LISGPLAHAKINQQKKKKEKKNPAYSIFSTSMDGVGWSME